MKLAALRLRFRAALSAVALGWLAAVVVTLPMQFVKISTNAFGGFRPLFCSLAAGALVWGAWLLALAGGAWLFGALPLIAIVSEAWLRRHPRRTIGISTLFGWSVVLFEFRIWRILLPDEHLPGRAFCLYTLSMTVLTGVAATVYLRLLARISGT
jgi:hypothetical protein